MKNLKEALSKPRKVAVYASLTMDNMVTVWEVNYLPYDEHWQSLPDGEKREHQVEGYVRISEPVEVSFTAVDNDSMVRNAVASIDEEERKLRSELNRKLAQLQDRRNQLLALTYQPEEVA